MNQYLDELKNNEYVREKALCGNVHSFNYSNKAFFEGHWNSVTTRARGLFCDMDTETIVVRLISSSQLMNVLKPQWMF